MRLKQQNKLEKFMKQINKVSKKDCLDAIEYLHTMGYVEEMKRDKKHYVEILLKKVANDYLIRLDGIDDDSGELGELTLTLQTHEEYYEDIKHLIPSSWEDVISQGSNCASFMYQNYKILIGHKLGHADREENPDIHLAPSQRFRVQRFVGNHEDDWEKDSYCNEGFTCESFQELLKFLESDRGYGFVFNDKVIQHRKKMKWNYTWSDKYSSHEILDRMVKRSIKKKNDDK